MGKIGWNSLNTPKGRRECLAICVILILLSSFIAGLIANNFGKINITEVVFDARGAAIHAQLYTPVGVSSKDSLPAVIITHGGGCSNGIMQGTAQELARRNFVVLNVSAYGCGSSEAPLTDETGAAVGEFITPRGILDAVNYVRTLAYVDKTRIGITGHSMGGIRTSSAASLDVSYLTLNDMMINTLTDTFGQSFTREEIDKDADSLAQARLSKEQMNYYLYLKEVAIKYLSTRVKAQLNLGIGPEVDSLYSLRTVKVGGYDVKRPPQINGGFLSGKYDEVVTAMFYSYDYASMTQEEGMVSNDHIRQIYQTGTENVVPKQWYMLNDYIGDSEPISNILGDLDGISVASDKTLEQAIEERKARIFFMPNETHSENFFSPETTGYVVKFFEQTLGYNNGNLSDANTVPLSYTNTIFVAREWLNAFAMIFMLLMLFPLASMLMNTNFFAVCKTVPEQPFTSKKKPNYWIISVLIAFVGAFVFYNNVVVIPASTFFPRSGVANESLQWIINVAIASTVALLVNYLVTKKDQRVNYLTSLHVNLKIKTFFKTLLLGLILFFAAYLSYAVINTLFAQDYRFWLIGFTNMTLEQFGSWARYFIVSIVPFLISGLLINSGRMRDMKEGWNTLLVVLFSALGLLVLVAIDYSYMYTKDMGLYFGYKWVYMIGLVFLVPINTYITRKMYNISGSVWLGSFVNAALVAWLWSSMTDTAVYLGGSLITKFFGI